jgi:fructose-bisphosphate aldolase class I
LVAGNATADLVVTLPGQLRIGQKQDGCLAGTYGGGQGANVAFTLALLGVPVRFAGVFGTGRYGALSAESLTAVGVRVHDSRWVPDADGRLAVIVVSKDGASRTIVMTDDLHVGTYEPEVGARPDLTTVEALYVDGELPTLSCDLARRARVARLWTFGNCERPEERWTRHIEHLNELVMPADVLTAMFPGAQLDAAMHHVLDIGPDIVVATRGADGAACCQRNGSPVHVSSLETRVVDTTGAGDAFAAGYVAARLSGLNPVEACAYGTSIASMTCQVLGPRLTPQTRPPGTARYQRRAASPATAAGAAEVESRIRRPGKGKYSGEFQEMRGCEVVAGKSADLRVTSEAMVADGKGILAADESTSTIAKRFAEIGVESTPVTRQSYRVSLFSAPDLSQYISAVILYDETLRQQMDDGTPIPQFLASTGIIPGIKVDRGLVPFHPASGEQVTEGLDGLNARLAEYRSLGARFAKWRALLHIGSQMPSSKCIEINAWLLGRYARVCQDEGIVPIVEPEVLMTGDHNLARCADVTREALRSVFEQCRHHEVELSGMVLKPNMVTPGSAVFDSATPADVARETVAVLKDCVPPEVPGVAFLSGGQTEAQSTANLDEIAARGPHPWHITFSFGRALQASAMQAWSGDDGSRAKAQEALLERASQNSRVLLARR